ncbi:cholecystokinin-like [Poeciliopsis prolifica]|uniref:cholecystokinin-like n=1 Tax=Poeciliopsis prolifica TaxID=188132 RepID=UPI002412F919|nr:cholecystokinin-like [Poeciliopsis prolifica]
MNVGIYVCVILAALSSGSLSLPPQSVRAESPAHLTNSLHAPSSSRTRQVRSAPAPPSDRFAHYSQLRENAEAPNSLSRLLARLIPRKGSAFQIRSSLSSRAAPSHRIEDRDYLGWMDFGRRSAEEYEYSP